MVLAQRPSRVFGVGCLIERPLDTRHIAARQNGGVLQAKERIDTPLTTNEWKLQSTALPIFCCSTPSKPFRVSIVALATGNSGGGGRGNDGRSGAQPQPTYGTVSRHVSLTGEVYAELPTGRNLARFSGPSTSRSEIGLPEMHQTDDQSTLGRFCAEGSGDLSRSKAGPSEDGTLFRRL